MQPEMTTGSLEPMRTDTCVRGPVPPSLPPRTTGAGTPKELRS